MKNPAIKDQEGNEVPEGIMDAFFTVCISIHDIIGNGAYKISKTNISVSITGIAGPKGGTKKKPVGLVYIGIKKGNKILVKKYLFKKKQRIFIQRAAVNKALNLILSFIK